MGRSYDKKNCLIIGAGKSGKGAARLLLDNGAEVTLFDENEKCDTEAIRSEFGENENIKVIKGKLPSEVKEKAELAVLSPGVPLDSPLVLDLKAAGIPLTGEIELAYSVSRGDLLAITGTNGKTTTTTLLGDIMKNHAKSTGGDRKVFVVGNIGEPYTLYAGETEDNSITVAEISSFQLETVSEFRPRVSAILNVTPDHLNRHHTMEAYAEAKQRIMENQGSGDTVVLNYDDPITKEMGKGLKADVVYFSRDEKLEPGDVGTELVHLRNGEILFNERPIVKLEDIKLLGSHNHENIMAAVAMAVKYGVPDSVIRDTVASFKAVEHRIEYVETVEGVDYYNDSKGTNPDAAIKAVLSMVKPTVLIGGGYDKKSTYDELIESFEGRIKLLVLIGETAESIRECALSHGFDKVIMATDLKNAVDICHDNTVPGDAVLLSPACASWDMFKNYEERGTLLKEYVRKL